MPFSSYIHSLLLIVVYANVVGCSEISVFPSRHKNLMTVDFWASPYEMFHVTCTSYSKQVGSWEWSLTCISHNYPFSVDEEKKYWYDSPVPSIACNADTTCMYNHSSNFIFQYYGGSNLCNVTCSYFWANLTSENRSVVFYPIKPPEDDKSLEVKKCYQGIHWESPSVATLIFFIVLFFCLLHYYTLPDIAPSQPIVTVSNSDKKRIMKTIFGEIGDAGVAIEETSSVSNLFERYQMEQAETPVL